MLEVLLLAGALNGLPASARVDGERSVERARYRFVIGATRPFDEVYPRVAFVKKVAREVAEERVLRRSFRMVITTPLLHQEFDRIEKNTKAPDQWQAIKTALGNDRRRIEEVFCRPLLVERALREKFAFDPQIHAGPHQRAREARAAFLAGRKPAAVSVVVLAREGLPAKTDEVLVRAQRDSVSPRTLEAPPKRKADAPLPIDPELAAVLQRELVRPGDVTTILEERDRFSVFRLIEKTGDAWRVEAVTFPKVDFDPWFERIRRSA